MNPVFKGYEQAFILKSRNYSSNIRDDIEQFLSENEINSSEKLIRLINCLDRKTKKNKLFPFIDKQMFLVYGFFLNMVFNLLIDLENNLNIGILFSMALMIIFVNVSMYLIKFLLKKGWSPQSYSEMKRIELHIGYLNDILDDWILGTHTKVSIELKNHENRIKNELDITADVKVYYGEEAINRLRKHTNNKIHRYADVLLRKKANGVYFPPEKEVYIVEGTPKYLGTLAHELRHVYQYTCRRNQFEFQQDFYEMDQKYSVRLTEWDANMYAKEYLEREMIKVSKFSTSYFKLHKQKNKYKLKAKKIERTCKKVNGINLESNT